MLQTLQIAHISATAPGLHVRIAYTDFINLTYSLEPAPRVAGPTPSTHVLGLGSGTRHARRRRQAAAAPTGARES
eukprot:scaffold175_cov150-Isochrysis_galbana.AAC.10